MSLYSPRRQETGTRRREQGIKEGKQKSRPPASGLLPPAALSRTVIKSGYPFGEVRLVGGAPLPSPPSPPPQGNKGAREQGSRRNPRPVPSRIEAMAWKMAERLVADRVREIEEVAQERSEAAYRSGVEDGRSLGRQAAREEMAPLLEALNRMTQEIGAQRDRLLERTENAVLQLAVAIARRILRTELTARPEAMLDIVRTCLSQVKESTRVVVRVHPADEQILRTQEERLQEAMGRFGAWELRGDAQVSRGGCLIETDFGTLDGRVESQLEEIERALRREYRTETANNANERE